MGHHEFFKLRPIERYAIKMVEAEYYEPWLEEEAREIEVCD